MESSNEIWPNPRWNDPKCLAGEVIVSGSIRSYSSDMQNYLKRGLDHLAEQFHSTATISFAIMTAIQL